MRLSLRFVLPLLLAIGLVAYAVRPLVDQLTLKWFVRDLDIRAMLIAKTVQDPLVELVRTNARTKIATLFNRIAEDERIFALGFCDALRHQFIGTRAFPSDLGCDGLDRFADGNTPLLARAKGPLHVAVETIRVDNETLGKLVIVHDMSFVARRSEETKRYVFWFLVALGALVSLITVVVAQLSWRGWVQGMKALLRGEGLLRPATRITMPELQPLARDLRTLMRELESDYRPRDESQITWTPETLRAILRADLRGEEILVVSNREPYIHTRRNGRIEVQRPASGLVTALEPIMRACSGTWIAHGSGTADREVVDRHDRVGVPPGNPRYRIRRVWLTAEEEAGYYYGFSNEGLWPLCHIAHVRPTFRAEDWNHYVAANRRFARAVVAESRSSNPIVLVQDYHFALLPKLVRDEMPDATVITFWHIPWPNPEAFGILPWREEVLTGLLGSSILGFHTRFHVNNFVDTVDRVLEARVDRETFNVTYGGRTTAVKRYPISIEWPPGEAAHWQPVPECRAAVRARYAIGDDVAIGIGVDRMDYTKGILERFRAVERLLELEPQWIGRFTFVQVCSPTRSRIEEYQEFEARLRALAARINARFARGSWSPVVLRVEHAEPPEVYEHFRAADVCFVSSLHDGMNLVAKEFIAARDDERGVLILSQFTGAARELPEALVVNPYDTDQCAAALHLALTMPAGEQRDRMHIMRGLVREFNVYRWAGRMLLDAATMRRRGKITEHAVGTVIPLRREEA
ncbi:MAG TPA: trehalose-6-phosphate synthase [Burkholderiales bacterium]|nr:trehalose-6-phosphate synthase [Burkholderiales bacterium]